MDKIYLLWLQLNRGNISLVAIYSSRENAENEVEAGEVYCIQEMEIDRLVKSPEKEKGWKTK